jgi:NADPH-dependent 2,4-dienoyl-CoA reductase/sulfur reductase-like enzyme
MKWSQKMEARDVIIIGGGPAGITFASKLKKLAPQRKCTMFRPEAHSMVYCAIPYAIEGLFDPVKVFKRDDLVTGIGVELLKRSVASVDFEKRLVIDETGASYTYRTLYIATGAVPIRPPIPGTESANVFTVKTGQDMTGIIDKVNAGAKRAVVVGAGAIGIEQAQAYQARGIETWLVDMATYALPNMIDPEMSEPLHEALREKGVHQHFGAKVESLEKTDVGVRQVRLSTGEAIDLNPEKDFLCFAVGMKPDVDLFRGGKLEMTRDGIVVDSRMRTNIPDVMAAGDCCAFYAAIDEKPLGGKLATNAVPMAKIAARVLAGKDDEYIGFYNGAATCVEDWRIGATGFTATVAESRGIETIVGYGETTTLFPMMPGADTLKLKIVADRKTMRVIGGQVISKLPATDKTDVITLAIQRRMTLKGLSKLSYSAQPWQSFFPARSAIVEACENALDAFAAKEPFHYPDLMECV